MNIDTSHLNDIRTQKTASGAYEWWYFDATGDDGRINVVIIFYEGNPFSRRYISRQQNSKEALAKDFPAISISVYKDKKPLYYSFTEADSPDASFAEDHPFAAVNRHSMKGRIENGECVYTINLKEKLPSGDAIVGKLIFKSPHSELSIVSDNLQADQNHRWNLIQPRARVEGTFRCFARNETSQTICFKGQGYHDHNMGREPLKNEFEDWYWGRFHLKDTTLIYYAMPGRPQKQYGWLISQDNSRLLATFDTLNFEDFGRNLYGLSSARKIVLKGNNAEALVQQTVAVDNGPFYQRFSSDIFLKMSGQDRSRSASGISEYLCPPRIYNKLYWPLTNMRIRYQKEQPHWVQRSKMLYRWTW